MKFLKLKFCNYSQSANLIIYCLWILFLASSEASVPRGKERLLKLWNSIPKSYLDIDPYIVKGVNNMDRSPDFISYLQKTANDGDMFAQWFLGGLYVLGDGITQNINDGVLLMQKSAASGFPPALTTLGIIYLSDEYGPTKPDEAFKLLSKAALMAYPNAQLELASCFEKGVGTNIDLEQCIKWTTRAAEQLDPQAMHSLGLYYFHGKGVKKNLSISEKWLKQSFLAGYQEAKCDLGILCLENSERQAEGMNLLKESAADGNGRALFQLALISYHGLYGNKINYDNYISFLRMASDRGYPYAQFQLASELRSGQFLPRDHAAARVLASSALRKDFPEAQVLLADMLAAGEGQRGQELIFDIISVIVTLFANSFGLFRPV